MVPGSNHYSTKLLNLPSENEKKKQEKNREYYILLVKDFIQMYFSVNRRVCLN